MRCAERKAENRIKNYNCNKVIACFYYFMITFYGQKDIGEKYIYYILDIEASERMRERRAKVMEYHDLLCVFLQLLDTIGMFGRES